MRPLTKGPTMNKFLRYYLAAIATGVVVVAVTDVILNKLAEKEVAENNAKKKADVEAMLLAEKLVKMNIRKGHYLNNPSRLTAGEDWEFLRMVIRYDS
jgi:hypothetical protein